MTSRQEYEAAFTAEAKHHYQGIAELEQRLGFAINPAELEERARVLACPLKVNPPNWQHGRVIYSLLRDRLRRLASSEPVLCLDIGTAKGFSALCARLALRDALHAGDVISVDVIDPAERVRRNTIAEVDGLCTLEEIHRPFPEARSVCFLKSTGVAWLNATKGRIHFAFVDGKHDPSVVSIEGALIASRQRKGDVILFDDVHLNGVRKSAEQIGRMYYEGVSLIPVIPEKRAYLWGVRR